MHQIYDVRHPPLRVEPERPLDGGTEWIVGRSTESVGQMSADCRLADSHRKYLQLEYFVLCRHTARVSPRVRETQNGIRYFHNT